MRINKTTPGRLFNGTILLMSIVMLSSCAFAPYNRIISDKDPYKQEASVKMKQLVRGYSNERKHRFHYLPHYTATVSYLSFKSFEGNEETIIEIAVTTHISDREITPKLYLNLDNEIFELESEDYVYKEFNRSSTSTSSTITTDTETKKDKETGKDKEVSSTSTTFSSTTDDNAYQLMRHRYYIPNEVVKELRKANHIIYRVYRGDEGIDIEPDRKDRRKIRKFFRSI